MPHHETSQAAKTQLSSGRQIEGSTALFSGLISGRGLNWTYAEKKRDANEVTNSLCSDSTLKKNGADFFQVAMARVTLNLIVEFDIRPKDQGGVAYEYDWIRHLVLGGINRPIKTWIVPHGPTPRLNNSLLVFLFGPRGGGTFFKEMRKEGYTNLGAYHMGNEHFNNDVSYYK